MAMYLSTKTYGNDRGLSCCFRQWHATHSHCSKLHGYAIGIKLVFSSTTLDERNWVMDFGGLKEFKNWSEYMFDHTLIVANDDPALSKFTELQNVGLANLRIVDAVGCEKFAEMAYYKMVELIDQYKKLDYHTINRNVRVVSVEISEHLGNSAIFAGDHE
jgi:6-pyruvoyltetrahydropterin/6-carboxytetrahydropterin synthase